MKTKYTPTAGRAFITPEQRFEDTGLIEIPKKYRKQKKAVARVQSWSPGIRFKCSCGYVQHIKGACRHCQRNLMQIVSSEPAAPFDVDITGLRVLYAEASVLPIEEGLFCIPIDDIIAIIPDDVDLDEASDANGARCKFCGPCKDGSANGMLLVPINGKIACPRCRKDVNGAVVE